MLNKLFKSAISVASCNISFLVLHAAFWLTETSDACSLGAPPVTFPRPDGKIKKIEFPEDVYVRKFNKKHPDSLYHDAIK